jgi:urea transport system ATP-binding protein
MLKVDNLDLYYGEARILKSVSFEAAPGGVFCLLGNNGAGKSSLLNAIVGRAPIASGKISWNGRALEKMRIYERARLGVGYVPQGREIFPLMTVKENLQTGFAAAPKDQRFVPDDIYELFPALADIGERRGGDLSGGQQQQLAIARALVARPSLLILDEPTEGIQPNVITEIGNVLKRLREAGDMTILLVEQYLDFARELADAFAVVERGEIVFSGTAADLDAPEIQDVLSL